MKIIVVTMMSIMMITMMKIFDEDNCCYNDVHYDDN